MEQALQDAEQISQLSLSQPQKVALSFDSAFDLLDELDDWDWDDSTSRSRDRKANKVAELAKESDRLFRLACSGSYESEYASIGTHVFPRYLRNHGKDVLRANEQCQEQHGQNVKGRYKKSNKREKMCTYKLWNKKKKEHTTCKVTATRNEQTLLAECNKVDAYHRIVSRLTCKTRGGELQRLLREKSEKGNIKRERVQILPLLLSS